MENGDFQYCRSCYGHLAGKVAVELTDSLLKQKLVTLNGTEFIITPKGGKWFEEIGIDLNTLKKTNLNFAKPCLDGTEKKYHLAGSLGAALLAQMQKNNWVNRKADSRIVLLTEKGEKELRNLRTTHS